MVEEATIDENTFCNIHPATMEELHLYKGDIVTFKGKRHRDTVCIAMGDQECGKNKIRINKVVRSNLHVRLDDVVSVHQCHDARYGAVVHVLPIDDTVQGITGNLFEAYLSPTSPTSSALSARETSSSCAVA